MIFVFLISFVSFAASDITDEANASSKAAETIKEANEKVDYQRKTLTSLQLIVDAFEDDRRAREADITVAGEPQETHVIEKRDQKFFIKYGDQTLRQKTLEIYPGDMVIFRNADRVVQSVFSNSKGNVFWLGKMSPGEERSVRFKSPGSVKVRDAIHPTAVISIEVRG